MEFAGEISLPLQVKQTKQEVNLSNLFCFSGYKETLCLRFPSIQTLTGSLNITEADRGRGKFRVARKTLSALAS